jgi:hypothetical protein
LDKSVVKAAVETINAVHHASGTLKNVEVVSKELLCPTANLVDGTIIFWDFTHNATVT